VASWGAAGVRRRVSCRAPSGAGAGSSVAGPEALAGADTFPPWGRTWRCTGVSGVVRDEGDVAVDDSHAPHVQGKQPRGCPGTARRGRFHLLVTQTSRTRQH